MVLRPIYGIVSPHLSWRETWIVAGGPSARRFDPSALDNKNVLAVNDAIHRLISSRSLTPAVAVFSADHRWVRRNRVFLESFGGEKYFSIALDTWPDCMGISGATYLHRGYGGGLSEDPRALEVGGNSGYAAINLAYLRGAQSIHLVGFDMLPADGEKFQHWAPRFRTMIPQLTARGVQVLNHNPDSAIDAFQKTQ